MDKSEKNCPELTQETANAIDDDSLHELFVSSQTNNVDLCVKFALQWDPHINGISNIWHTSDMFLSLPWIIGV